MAGYRIWFDPDGKNAIELPVNPQEVTIMHPGNPTNYDVEGIGEIIIPRIPKLATVSFDSFFPREKMFQAVANSSSWFTPEWYVTFFRNLQKSRKPFELTIARGYDTVMEYDENGDSTFSRTDYFDTVFKAVLLDFSITDKGGEPGDVYYNMSISEYRDASPQTLSEVAKQEKDDDGNVTRQQRVEVVNRPPQTGVICEGRLVTIFGKTFEIPDMSIGDWSMTKADANRLDSVVTRVLPPEASGVSHSVYVSGLGWVDKGNCKLSESAGTITSMQRLVTQNYD